MQFTIEKGVLKQCLLKENERAVRIPESVAFIADGAFRGIPEGQLRRLTLPDRLEGIASRAFEGLGMLERLTVYTHGDDGQKGCIIGWETSPPVFLKTEALVIRRGRRGSFFSYSDLLDCGFSPRSLTLELGMEVRPTYHELEGYRDIPMDTEELTVYIRWGERGDALSVLLAGTTMRSTLKKLRFISRMLRNPETGEFRDSGPGTRLYGPEMLIASRTGWEWAPLEMPLDIAEMEALEEIVLPQGLAEVPAGWGAFCPALKKVVFPSSLRVIGDCAFPGCSSLRDVWFCRQSAPRVSPSAFAGCRALKTAVLYEEGRPGPGRKGTARMDASAWLDRCRAAGLARELDAFLCSRFADDTPERHQALRRCRETMEAELARCPDACRAESRDSTLFLYRVSRLVRELRDALQKEAALRPDLYHTDSDSLITGLNALIPLLEFYAWKAEEQSL